MFKKPKRNFRGRRAESGSDDEKVTDRSPPYKPSRSSPAKTVTCDNKKEKGGVIKKVASANSVLSFASDEEDGEVFQVKKPNHSKRIVKQLKKQTNPEDIKVEAGITKGSKSVGNGTSGVKQEEPEKQLRFKSGSISSGNESDGDSDQDEKPGLLVQNILKSGQIPDASLIHLARKRRQLARERGGDDFVPLDDNPGQSKQTSRLIRDDDDDRSSDSGDDFAITNRQKDMERRRKEETILAANEAAASDASDKEQEWEEQQIRKGVSIPAQPVTVQSNDDYYTNYRDYVFSNTTNSSNYTAAKSGTILSGYTANLVGITHSGNIHDSGQELPALTVDSVKKRLTDRLAEMVGVHRVHVHERDDLFSRTELSTETIDKNSSQAAGLEEQYKFFQEMRGYVRDLVECLNEKMASINYLERCAVKLYKERADKLIKRRQDDVKDQSMEYLPGKTPANRLEEIIDEDKKHRRADREGRRARRRRTREAAGIRDHNDGMSTDDELYKSDTTKFAFTRDELSKSANTMFDDVMDDFCQPHMIRARFETWRRDYADSYNEAYIGLCLSKLFTPFVKVELVCWNPLEEDCCSFEEHQWFNQLVFYGWSDNDKEPDDLNDYKLVPTLVDKVVIPRLTGFVESTWDPLSAKQTRRLTSLVRQLIAEYPTVHADSKNTQLLVKAVIQRIKKCLDDDIFMPLYPKQILENRTSEAAIFFHRQFWTCIKLMKNIILWHGIVSDRQLMELAFDSLLNRYLIIAFQNSVFGLDYLSKSSTIVEMLPKEWFLPCTGDATLPQLENFCRCLVSSASSLCPSQPGVLTIENRDMIRQAIRQLLTMRSRNQAVLLATKSHLNVND